MAARLCLFYVIYQIVITASFGGVTLPFSDIVGKVTPVKPKPLTPSSIPSPGLAREPLITKSPCNSEDIIPKLFSPPQDGSVFHKFSSTLQLTTSSRPLPVPKIDTSILNENFPKRFPKKTSTPKVKLPPLISSSSTPINGNVRPNICVPEIPIPTQSPYVALTSPLNSLPGLSSPDVCTSLSNKPNINSLSAVPLEPLIKGADAISSIQTTSLPSVTPSFYSTALNPELPLLKARNLLFRELSSYDIPLNTNLSPYSSSSTLLYPIYYKPMYLPNVRTPEALNYPSTSSGPSISIPNAFTPLNILSPSFINPVSNPSSASINSPLATSYCNSVKTTEIPRSINTIPKPVSVLNTNAKNPLLPLDTDTYSIVLDSNIVKPLPSLPSSVSRDGTIPTSLLSPNRIITEVSPNIAPTVIPKTPLIPPKISPVLKPSLSSTLPLNFLKNPSLPISQTSYTRTPSAFLPNHISDFDIVSDMLPIVETIDTTNTDDLIKNLQARINFDYMTNLNQINIPELFPIPLLPEVSGYQTPSFSEQYVTKMPVILPPTTKGFSSRISQTPISYVNVSPTSSVSQCTSNMVSSINDIVSNIAQNILSSVNYEYVSKCMPTNPYQSTLSPVDSVAYLNSQLMDSIIASTLDTPVSLAAPVFETPVIPLLPSPQLTTTIVPLFSPISFSPPRLCPSYLPSPALPSYATISSPFYMEPQGLKVSTPNNDPKDIDKMLELVLLADFLSGDDNFEWNDIDKLLALLSAR